MDILKVLFDVAYIASTGTGDLVSYGANFLLNSIGISGKTAESISSTIGVTSSVAISGAGVVLTVYGAIKIALFALFRFSPEAYINKFMRSVGNRLALRARAIVIKTVHEKDAQAEIKKIVTNSIESFWDGVKDGMDGVSTK